MDFSTPNKIWKAYRDGLAGAVCDPEDTAALLAESKHPVFGVSAHKLYGSGEGKLSLPFKSLLKFDPGFGPAESQDTGDCTTPTSLVRMADGELKPIIDVKVGDMVLSHSNTPRMVTRFIKKEYSGKMVRIFIDKIPTPIELTPDHKVHTYPDIALAMNNKNFWRKRTERMEEVPAGEIKEGDRISVPYGLQNNTQENFNLDLLDIIEEFEPEGHNYVKIKGTNKPIKRFIEIDEDFCWMIGMYLAEGGVDKNSDCRLEFSLANHEKAFGERIYHIIKDKFNVESKVYTPKNRQDLTLVRVYSKNVCKFFKHFIPGNIYTKSIPSIIFKSNLQNRISCIRGWMDGDGHLNTRERKNKPGFFYCSVGGVTVSKRLAYDMLSLCLSCNLRPAFVQRKKAQHQNVAAMEVRLYSDSVLQIYPEETASILDKVKVAKSHADKVTNGLALKVKRVEEYDYSGFVYCLEVEKEHTFQCNFINQNNCVSHATRNAIDITRAVEIDIKGEAEAFLHRGATEGIYQFRHGRGQGMSCSGAARYVSSEGGILLRKDYGEIDLSVYNATIGIRKQIPRSVWIDVAQKNQVKTVSLVSTVEEARDAIANGYGVVVCSNYGFSSRRDSNGIARRKGRWMHAMCMAAVDDTRERYNETLFLIINSWGKWNSGPKVHDQPDGSFWIRESDARGMLSQQSSFVYSDVDGFPPRDLPDYGTTSYL